MMIQYYAQCQNLEPNLQGHVWWIQLLANHLMAIQYPADSEEAKFYSYGGPN